MFSETAQKNFTQKFCFAETSEVEFSSQFQNVLLTLVNYSRFNKI